MNMVHTMATFFQLCPSLTLSDGILVSLFSLLFVSCILKLWVKKSEMKMKAYPPEVRGALPIIGHLHILAGSTSLCHQKFGEMADKYGPIFSMKIGLKKILVVSSSEIAKEFLLKNHKSLNFRPKAIVTEVMTYGEAGFTFSSNVPFWLHMRKTVVNELLSNHRLDMFSFVWKEELVTFRKNLYDFWFKQKKSGSNVVIVDLKQWFTELSMNITVRIISGKKYTDFGEDGSELRKTIEDLFNGLGSFLVGDVIPFLRWLDLGGHEKAMKKAGKDIDIILQTWLQDLKQNRLSESSTTEKTGFMDVLLSVLDESRFMNDFGFDVDTINKSTCLLLIAGASDTLTVVLTWAISLLLNNRDELKKAQDELEVHVGKDRHVNESDISKLDYIQAIVKETLRMYPPAPLGGPREFTEDCSIGGYDIKKGTKLIVNVSKIHSDPRVWENPMEFRPERFLTTHKDVDVRGQNLELIPFGFGRRMCPGYLFSLRTINFLLASFLQAFQISTFDDALVDMTEGFGVTNLKATPLDVIVVPRLSTHMHE